jgi:hypothetical protein
MDTDRSISFTSLLQANYRQFNHSVHLSRALLSERQSGKRMRSKNSLQEQGIPLRLAAPSKAVDRIFSVTGFKDYFDIFPSRDAAIST